MNILVISGFLGAGKTTFIGSLAAKTGKSFAVMENEYGSTGIDGNLLQQDRLKVWELTEGCICCSLQSDFASSILTIANTIAPEYLVVEPTGIGLLSAVMRNINKIAYERIQLLDPVTIVDIHCVDAYISEFGELYTDQIKYAARIVLSKIERTEPSEIARISALLRTLNPHAEILSTPYQNQPEQWWQALLESFYSNGKKQSFVSLGGAQSPNLENVGCTGINIASVYELMELLVALMRGFFGTVYRVKGYAPIAGTWTKFDLVNKQYTIELCKPMGEAKAVVIGEHLAPQALYAAFRGSAC